jgi:hypothetical protein
MKKVLAVVLAVAFVSMWAYAATAQTPHVVVFFDEGAWTQTTEVCRGNGVLDTLAVVAVNFGMWMSAIEYSITYPDISTASLVWLADMPVAPLNIGNTAAGVASSWPLPQNAFAPLGVMNVLVKWLCDDCSASTNAPIIAGPHLVTGFVRATRWPDNVLFEGTGLTSLVCPVVPVEEKTWGGVKALYDN